mgnify:CR=1 FL=1
MAKKIPMPTDGKGPMMSTGGKKPLKPEAQLKRVAKGAATKGSGSDTSPYSSARKGR